MLQRKNYAELASPAGPYVHAVKYKGLLFLSGLTAYSTPAQGSGIEAQANAIFAQIRHIAEAEGTGLEALIKVTIFIRNMSQIESLRACLFLIYGDNLPASSLVQVAALFSTEIDMEIEAILAVNE
jgi:2-iminobutanoate/2-iminopropanoate deaminase